MPTTVTVRGVGDRCRAYLELARPANVVTAAADVIAGYALVGAPGLERLAVLVAVGMLLYAGGVVLNDAFDAPRDARDRPERPIPSGRASRIGAFAYGSALLVAGVALAGALDVASLLIAAAVALTAVLYDADAKHHAVAGPLTMAGARGLNLLLGASAAPLAIADVAPFALLGVAHVAALTLISRGETTRAPSWAIPIALAAAGIVTPLLIVTAPAPLVAAPFAVAYAWLVWPSYWRLRRATQTLAVRRAVRNGVLALIALNAALAAGHAGPLYGLAIALLWPIAAVLARRFSVS